MDAGAKRKVSVPGGGRDDGATHFTAASNGRCHQALPAAIPDREAFQQATEIDLGPARAHLMVYRILDLEQYLILLGL